MWDSQFIMKAEDLIIMLQSHIGEDLYIKTQENDSNGEYGDLYEITWDIEEISNRELILSFVKSVNLYNKAADLAYEKMMEREMKNGNL